MKRKNIILLSILILCLILDQITKYIITTTMQLYDSVPIIEDFFYVTSAQNTGGAWSILAGNMIFFYLVTIVALVLLGMFFKSLKEHQFIAKIGIVLMIGGALGNFIDRLRLGYVIDFLDFNIMGYAFPIFNVADMCLCIGIGLVLVDEFLSNTGVGIWKRKAIK